MTRRALRRARPRLEARHGEAALSALWGSKIDSTAQNVRPLRRRARRAVPSALRSAQRRPLRRPCPSDVRR